MSHLVGCDSFGRDVHYFSTPNDTRPDFTALVCSVQLVICEEKDDDIKAAVGDIVNKFRFIRNYSDDIKVMFGFAISRNDFRIIKFVRSVSSDVPLSNTPWFSITLNSRRDRMKCIIAALNVGRVLKFYRMSDFLLPAVIPIGTWV